MTLKAREGHKKTEPILLSADQKAALKEQPDTPKGWRDKLLVCLALDHGLRVCELAILQRNNFYLEVGTMTFDRPETGQRATIQLSDETIEAARRYFGGNAPGFGNLWRPNLSTEGMLTDKLIKRIGKLGRQIAIDNLTPYDLRHTWAINAAQNTPLDQLIYAGGWASVSAALPYIENAKIAVWK